MDGSIVDFCDCRQSGKDDRKDDIREKVKELLRKLDKAADDGDDDEEDGKLQLQDNDVDNEPHPVNFNYGTDDDEGPQPFDDEDDKPVPYNMYEVQYAVIIIMSKSHVSTSNHCMKQDNVQGTRSLPNATSNALQDSYSLFGLKFRCHGNHGRSS